ncbi:MAG TPA: heme exporter protein CcmD [Gammaproteobacteria bacterium]|nr:heme exporter protein CcmD [Gammaproteobacteria bacterium]
MKSLHEFLVMGGYAAYVWPAYGIVALVLILNAWLPGWRLRRLLRDLKRQEPRA